MEIQVRIIERKGIADGVVKVTCAFDGTLFDFQPGQYVRMTLPELKFPDPHGQSRDLTISSLPGKGTISFTFRAGDNPSGFKKTLLALPYNTLITIAGPYGDMLLPPAESQRPLIFIAGGIGVTSFRSKIRHALADTDTRYHITLLWSGTNERNVPYLWELRSLAQEYKDRFHLGEVFGQRITSDMLRKCAHDRDTTPLWQIAGPPDMVDVMRGHLADLGVPTSDIAFEEYAGYGTHDGFGSIECPVGDVACLTEATSKNVPLYHGLLEALNKTALVSKTDLDGNIIFVNDTFLKVSGYDRAELIGKNHRILRSEHHPPEFYDALWETISNGNIWRGDIKSVAKDGSYYWADISIAPVFDENGVPDGYVSVRFLITDRKDAEEKLNMYQRGLEELIKERTDEIAQSNESLKTEIAHRQTLEKELRIHMDDLTESDRKKDEFIAILSHELRNPLSQILTTAETARLGLPVQCPILINYLSTIERQSYAMKYLLDDLLDVSRIMRGKITLRRELIDVAKIIRHAVDNIERTTSALQHTFDVVMPEKILIYADPVRLEQILTNLINNAVKYSPEGGIITITAKQEGTTVRIAVKDPGIGIERTKVHKIFGLFSQLDSNLFSSFSSSQPKTGLGIGLYISKIMTEMHGGTIAAHSDGEGRGSEFTIALPLLPTDISTLEESDRQEASFVERTGKDQRIMIIDDIVDLADAVGLLLGKMGYDTRVGYSGTDAIAIAKEYKPDIVLLDLSMPEMDGYETLKNLKILPELSETRFYAVSGFGQEYDHKHSIESGFTAHLVKPLGARDLQRVLEG